MKYFYQLNNILSDKQKKGFILITFLTFISMWLEILTLNSIFILLSHMANPSILNDSKIFFYLKNFEFKNLSTVIIIIFIVIFTFKTLFNIYINWKVSKFIYTTRAELSHSYFEGYLSQPLIFHSRSNTSNLIKNITIEVENVIAALRAVSVIVMEIIILFGLSFFLLFINLEITIISFFLLTIFSIVINLLNSKKILSMGKNRVIIVQKRLKSIIEGLSGVKIFELTGSRKNLIDNFSSFNNELANISYNYDFRKSLPKPLFELFILLIIGIIVIFAFRDQSEIKGIIPILGVFVTAAYRLIPSFGKILQNYLGFRFNIQAAKNLSRDKTKFNFYKTSIEKNIIKFDFKQKIDFLNISFSFNKNTNLDSNLIFKNASLTIKKGTKIGILGETGSGKSTFLDLVMGLISPHKGKIIIDGNKIEDIKSSWQKAIGCVPQEVFILDDTLKRNVAFGLPDELIDIQKVNKAIELANLVELKNSLSFGLETLLGESGSRLSGGQRQRIGIARALYTEPDILVFDEATNALDVQTEKKIINEIFSKKRNNTIVFVSHNQNNLTYCDLIYEVKNKKLYQIKSKI